MSRFDFARRAIVVVVFGGVVASPALGRADGDQTNTIVVPQQQPAPVVVTPQPAPAPVVINPSPVQIDEGTLVADPVNAGMFVTGATAFGASYLTSVIVAASSNTVGDSRLYVPVLGPWLDIHDRGSCPIAEQGCDGSTSAKVLLVVDGLFQAAGVIAMVDGILDPTHHRRVAIADRGVHVIPSVSPTSTGFAAVGHF